MKNKWKTNPFALKWKQELQFGYVLENAEQVKSYKYGKQ